MEKRDKGEMEQGRSGTKEQGLFFSASPFLHFSPN